MNRANLVLALCAVIFSFNYGYTQNICGMTTKDQQTEDFYESSRMVNEGFIDFRSVTTYVPIKFNMVGTSSGAGYLRHDKALDQLWKMNNDYNDQEIHFYLNEDDSKDDIDTKLFNYIPNDIAYTDPRASIATILFNTARDPKAMNLYIVQTIPPNDNTLGTILGYNDRASGRDWVVQLKNQTNATSSTMSHEAGHFFSVNHPHLGWESDPWGNDAEEMFSPAPTTNPGGVTTEYADGRNCTSSADNLCDTPADYNGLQFPCTDFTQDNVQDPDGVGIRPMVNNMMGYFGSCAEYQFTNDQKNQIIANIGSNRRNYLRPGLAPTEGDIIEKPTLSAPIDTTTVMNDQAVTLTWNAVPNAKYYLINIGRCNNSGACSNSFTSGFQQYLTTETSFEIPVEDLQNNKRFYWNVRPFNTHFADPAMVSDIEIFRTGVVSSTNEIAGLNQYSISPNPISNESSLTVKLNADRSLTQATIVIRDIAGKLIHKSIVGQINSGSHNIKIDLPQLSDGIYTVSLLTDQGSKTSRLVKVN